MFIVTTPRRDLWHLEHTKQTYFVLSVVLWISFYKNVHWQTRRLYCSASEVRHPSEVRHLHFITILKSFYCSVTAYMYTLPLEEAIPFI